MKEIYLQHTTNFLVTVCITVLNAKHQPTQPALLIILQAVYTLQVASMQAKVMVDGKIAGIKM